MKPVFYPPPPFDLCFPVTGRTVRKTDIRMARTAKGLCPECETPVNENGECPREACR